MGHGLRKAIVLLSIAYGSLAAPAAHAGEFDVQSCGGPASGVNHAGRQRIALRRHLTFMARARLRVRMADSRLRTNSKPATLRLEAAAGWSVSAPAGTRISRLRYHRYIGKEADDSWLVGTRLSDGTMLETCSFPPLGDRCAVGSDGYLSGSDYFDSGSISTNSLTTGIECPVTATVCGNGATIHRAWAAIYASTVTLDDLQIPNIASPAGSAWTNTGFHKGVETASFDASDNTGIQRTRVVVDGVPLDSAATSWPCDFTYTVPCQDRSPNYAVNTNEVADGGHTLTLSAVDPGSNERTISRAIVVDNHAPAAPSGLAVVGGEGWHDTTSFAVTWNNPPGQVAPIVAADYELCNAVGCSTSQVVGPDIHRIDDVRVPLAGDYTLSVWLEDAAGNSVATNRSASVHLRSGKAPTTTLPPGDPGTPATPTTPRARPGVKLGTARLSGAHLLVRGTLRKEATGTVRVTYRVRAHGRTIEHRGRAPARRGRFRISVRLSRSARRATRGTLIVRYGGDAHYRAQTARRTVRARGARGRAGVRRRHLSTASRARGSSAAHERQADANRDEHPPRWRSAHPPQMLRASSPARVRRRERAPIRRVRLRIRSACATLRWQSSRPRPPTNVSSTKRRIPPGVPSPTAKSLQPGRPPGESP